MGKSDRVIKRRAQSGSLRSIHSSVVWIGAFVVAISMAASQGLAADNPLDADTLEPVWTTDAEAVLTQIRATAELPGGDSVKELLDEPVLLWVERCHIGSDNYFSSEEVRYAVVRLIVANNTSDELVIKRENIALRAAGRMYPVGANQSLLRTIPLQIDWHVDGHIRHQSELRTPRQISIAPHQAAAFWCVFAGLQGLPSFPEYKISVQADSGHSAMLDLTAQQNARLGLSVQQIGPHNALTVLTIHGQLNRANAPLLARELTRATERDGKRFLINWAPSAKPSDEFLLNWLMSAAQRTEERIGIDLHFPPLPSVRKLALADLALENRKMDVWESASQGVFKSSDVAAASLLQEIYERVDPQTALQEIRNGHPWSRSAALLYAADRLPPAALPILLDLATGPPSDEKRGAILALGSQQSPLAESTLRELALSGQPDVAEAALTALLQSLSTSRRRLIKEILYAHPDFLDRARVLAILAQYYHPEWDPILVNSVEDPSPEVRVEALKSLHQVGHERLMAFCERALNDSESSVREEAFRILVDSHDRSAEKAATEYALRQLEARQFDEPILNYLERIRDPRAAPALLREIRRPGVSRVPLIGVLGAVGSSDDVHSLFEVIETFTDEERLTAMKLLNQVSVPMQLKVARQMAGSPNASAREMTIEVLKSIGSDDAISLLAEMLKDPANTPFQNAICVALGEIGTEQAIRHLRQFQHDAASRNDQIGLISADQGLRMWRSRLPGFNFVESGAVHESMDEHEEAIRAFSMAIVINPDLADAYSARGNVYLRLDQYQKAGEDFRKAFELDEYDGQAITGVAIINAIEGRIQEAVELIEQRRHRFPQDRFYAYNSACVYSRCIEALRKQPVSAQRDERIRHFEEQAIARLKESMKLGFRDADWMLRDPDLAAIRSLPQFNRLTIDE